LTKESNLMSPIKVILNRPATEVARQPYRITFLGEGTSHTVTVDPSHIPYGETGLPGSIVDIALGSGLDLEHACGGVAACSTCHVKVKDGEEACNEPSDVELDQLDEVPDLSLESRLGCQCVPNGANDLLVEIPSWNKNLVREGHSLTAGE
jgi:ferredoxin, 2Fe-2S